MKYDYMIKPENGHIDGTPITYEAIFTMTLLQSVLPRAAVHLLLQSHLFITQVCNKKTA